MEKRTTPKTPKAAKTAKATSKPSATKAPKVKTPKAKPPKVKAPKVKAPTPPADPLAGVTIRAQVITYAADSHRPRIRITTPTGTYYKLVPGVRTTTKAEALAAAQAYRDAILASGELPPQAPRPDRFGWGPGELNYTPVGQQPDA